MVRTRPAEDADYDTYVRLWPELRIVGAPAARANWVAQFLPHTLFAVAETGECIGYVLGVPQGEHGDVVDLVVDSSHRRRGVGRALMAAIAVSLRAAGCREWQLIVRPDNAAALALYASFGLREIGMHGTQLVLHGQLP